MGTGGALLAESSPCDEIWGTGVGMDNEDWDDVGRWTGRNLLGRILMEVREELGRELKASPGGLIGYDEDYYSSSIPEWGMRAGELARIPQYHQAVCAYSHTLDHRGARPAFLYRCTLAQVEEMMCENMGGGLPAVGFWEMKQDVYDTARYLRLAGIGVRLVFT